MKRPLRPPKVAIHDFLLGDTLDLQCNLPQPQQPINIQQLSAALIRLCHAFFMPHTFIDFAHLSMDFNNFGIIILGYALSKIEEILKIKQDVFVLLLIKQGYFWGVHQIKVHQENNIKRYEVI